MLLQLINLKHQTFEGKNTKNLNLNHTQKKKNKIKLNTKNWVGAAALISGPTASAFTEPWCCSAGRLASQHWESALQCQPTSFDDL